MRAKACFLLFCFMLLLFTPGCSQVNQLNERLIVNGIGVDIEDGAYVVTMHVFDAQRASAGGQESKEIVEETGRGRSVKDAFNAITLQSGKEPLLSQNLVLIVGEETAKSGMNNVIDFFIRYYETRPTVELFVAKERTAREVMNCNSDGRLISAKDIENLADSGEINAEQVHSDVLTLVKPRQHALFWADGEPNRGTFHTNFKLDSLNANWIGLYDSGKKLLDQIVVPAGVLKANQSYARVSDATPEWEVKGETSDKYVTPSTNNQTIDSNAKMEKFEQHDSVGIGMSISAMSVVFFGLILLYISFKIVGKISVNLSKRNAMRAKGITDKKEAKEKLLGEAPGEVFAAISLALHEMQSDVHDVEDTVLTITRVKRSYSPWSSKIYTLRETPQRK